MWRRKRPKRANVFEIFSNLSQIPPPGSRGGIARAEKPSPPRVTFQGENTEREGFPDRHVRNEREIWRWPAHAVTHPSDLRYFCQPWESFHRVSIPFRTLGQGNGSRIWMSATREPRRKNLNPPRS